MREEKIIKIPRGKVLKIYIHNKAYNRMDGSRHPGFYFEQSSLHVGGWDESQDAIKIVIEDER